MLAQGAWRNRYPKLVRPTSRREPTPGSRTRNGAPGQAFTPPTGVSGKYYRGPRQIFASGADHDERGTPKCRTNPGPSRVYWPSSHIPGFPTRLTGVPNKTYRGSQQDLPGFPTRLTGAANKYYRGAGQILPGRPTSHTGASDKSYRGARQALFDKPLQKVPFSRRFWLAL